MNYHLILIKTKSYQMNKKNIFFSLAAWVELEDTYELSAVNTLQDAVNTILKYLGLAAADTSGKVNQGVHTHTLVSSGKFKLEIFVHILNVYEMSSWIESVLVFVTTCKKRILYDGCLTQLDSTMLYLKVSVANEAIANTVLISINFPCEL